MKFEKRIPECRPVCVRAVSFLFQLPPSVRPEKPKTLTHTHDEDLSDEESDNKSEEKAV